MDKKHAQKDVGGEIIYPFPNFNGATLEIWEWINYFISHFIIAVRPDNERRRYFVTTSLIGWAQT